MSVSLFISKKYTLSKKDSRFITLISTISVIGIALGVAALIIALSILAGFEKTITEKITDFDSHIKITSYSDVLPDYKINKSAIEAMLKPYADYVNPYLSRLAIMSSRNKREGVSIKGINISDDWTGIEKIIVEGKFSIQNEEIIIGKKLANKLFLSVGDRVNIFALKNNEIPSPQNPPNIKQFTVSGIYESGMAQYDDLFAYVNLSQAQQLFSVEDVISGYDIKLNDISKTDSLTFLLADNLRYPHSVRSIFQIHRNIFTWIELQKKPIPIVLGLIIIVAVFNIIGTLLMIVLEKTNAIGTLKSLGAGTWQVITVFLYQGSFLAILGIVFGNLLAFVLLTLQTEYNIISLPSSVYFVSTVPILMKLEAFVLVSVVTFILSLSAAIIPSYIASRIKPVSTLRFN